MEPADHTRKPSPNWSSTGKEDRAVGSPSTYCHKVTYGRGRFAHTSNRTLSGPRQRPRPPFFGLEPKTLTLGRDGCVGRFPCVLHRPSLDRMISKRSEV